MPVDHMVSELVTRVIRRKLSGQQGAIEKINFEKLFTADFKEQLLLPIDPAQRGQLLPLPSADIKCTI